MVYEIGFAIVGIGCRFPGGVTSVEGIDERDGRGDVGSARTF